jgi:hypothetical protein
MNLPRIVFRSLACLTLIPFIVAACASPGWTLYVYNNQPTPVLARLTTDHDVTIRSMNSDQQGFVFDGAAKPAGATLDLLDPSSCAVLGTASQLAAQHALVVFLGADGIQVGVDDPGSQARDLLPEADICQ